MGRAELYKKAVIEYLETIGYYAKMDSFVEGPLADCILSRKRLERVKADYLITFFFQFWDDLARATIYIERGQKVLHKLVRT